MGVHRSGLYCKLCIIYNVWIHISEQIQIVMIKTILCYNDPKGHGGGFIEGYIRHAVENNLKLKKYPFSIFHWAVYLTLNLFFQTFIFSVI